MCLTDDKIVRGSALDDAQVPASRWCRQPPSPSATRLPPHYCGRRPIDTHPSLPDRSCATQGDALVQFMWDNGCQLGQLDQPTELYNTFMGELPCTP